MKNKLNIFYKILIILSIIIFLVFFFGSAFKLREQLYNEYYTGVELYEDKNYVEALEIFEDLLGWGRDVEPKPEWYYRECIKALKEIQGIEFCPYCNKPLN